MHKTIRVLHTEWSDGWGGQEIRIINEMLAVRERGVEVFLACRDHAVIKEKAEDNEIEVFTLPFRGSLDLKTLFFLQRILKKYRIDIVNTHSGKDTWVGGLAAKLAGIKFIRTRHLSNQINPSRVNFINELADYVITTGESVRTKMIDYNRIKPDKIQSIPSGVDEDIFDPAKYNRIECRERLKLKDGEIAIGIVAVLRGFKRHDYFIKAAKKLTSKLPEKRFKFFIVGDGPLRSVIEEFIERENMGSYIELLGHIDEVPNILAALDIVALTSDCNEGVPQSVIQALMMKKLVTATNVGSTSDLLTNNNFLIVPPLVHDISESLSTLVKCINKGERSASHGRGFIVANFSKRIMVDKVIDIYSLLAT